MKTGGPTKKGTARKKDSATLPRRESDRHPEKTSGQVPGMLYRFLRRPDGSFCVPFTTEAIRAIFGCTPEQVRDDFSPIARAILPQDLPRVVESINRSADQLTLWQCEYRVQLPGGPVRWMWGQSMPERLADGGVLWHGFNADVTERKRAEETLHREQVFTNAVLDSVPGLLYLYDDQGRLVRWNKQHEIITGYSAAELAAMSLLDWYRGSEEDIAVISRGVQRCLAEGYAEAEGNLRIKSGRRILFHFTAVRLEIDGRVYFAGIGIDVSARQRAEQERARMEAQLQEKEKMAVLGTLASGVAHEINNPNNFVMMNAEIFTQIWRDLEPKLEQYRGEHGGFSLAGLPYDQARARIPQLLAGLSDGSSRIKNIVRDLRQYALPDSGGMEPLDVNQALESALQLTRHQIAQATSRFSLSLEPGLPAVQGSRPKLEQVFINLLQNACQALNHADQAISVSTCSDPAGERIRVSVRDEGCGIPPENLERIFDPFFSTRLHQEGTGLGLSICQRIVYDHGGTIHVSSRVGQGTEMTVVLPAAAPSNPARD